MHMFVVFSVLAMLALTFGIIGGMLTAYRDPIWAALIGRVSAQDCAQKLPVHIVNLRLRTVTVTPRVKRAPLPLAA